MAMVDLSTASNTAIADLYSEENIYQYPEITELVGVDNCFAIVHNKFKITLGYNENTIADMASCLLELEMFFGNNKELIR